jgi:hypothetical protein
MLSRMSGILIAAALVILIYSIVAAIIVLTPELRSFYIEVGSIKISLILVWLIFFVISAALIWPVSLAFEANQLRAVVRGHLPLPERDLSDANKTPWKDINVSEAEDLT